MCVLNNILCSLVYLFVQTICGGNNKLPCTNRRGLPWTFKIANSLVLKRVHERIGLDCAKITLSGAAPIHRSTVEYFMSINIPLLELYGMSENTGPHSLNMIHKWRLGSVGPSMNGVHIKIDQPDENGEGEVSSLFIYVHNTTQRFVLRCVAFMLMLAARHSILVFLCVTLLHLVTKTRENL